MFWLIETPEQFEELCYKGFKQVYLEVVPSLDYISCIFIATPQKNIFYQLTILRLYP